MDKLGLNELRRRYLKFFEKKGHTILPSASLVPENDKGLLLINSGMAPLKPFFTGQEKPPSKRVTTCQKCIRTPDIERVGKTARHGTFFEMLGNFSFGDYFKEEAILWAWEFITEEIKLPIDKLWVSIYLDDDEAFEIWNKKIKVPSEKIVRMGKEDNFWEIGVGPCGPCSEIYYDRGVERGCGKPDCKIGCDCDRFVEFWNLVFTQYYRNEDGKYTPLANPNIDTGMGLERIAAIMQDVNSLFEVDTVKNIMTSVSKKANISYGSNNISDISLRVITDHIRGTTFMISDGILPTNEGRGYVLRRILRRAARHGKLLGINELFLSDIAKVVIQESSEAYPELLEKRDYILKVIQLEEQRFTETIDQGLNILKEYIDELKREGKTILSGINTFKLYDTYGFPIDLTREIVEEEGLEIDELGFSKEMDNQRQKARSARQTTDYMGSSDSIFSNINNIATEFAGYEYTETQSNVIKIFKDNKDVDEANENDSIIIILDKTPFYPESGGQIGDSGTLVNNDCHIDIYDTQRKKGNIVIHTGRVTKGTVRINSKIKAVIDRNKRLYTSRNHTTTHLLHKALKVVLGNHIEQAGSLVTPDKLRFDFTHFAPLSKEELIMVERIVNDKILEAINVETVVTDTNTAKSMGATALFGEKYGDSVRVVKIGDFSMELCGGTHISNTGKAGLFKIQNEIGIAAGIRRIEAITGIAVYDVINHQQDIINITAEEMKTAPENLISKVQTLMQQLKNYEKELDSLRSEIALSSVSNLLKQKKNACGIDYIAAKIENQDIDGLRKITDILRDKLGSGLIVLSSVVDNKIIFVSAATKDIISLGIHAGKLLKQIAGFTGGGGGGRPDMAQAGGKYIDKIDMAYSKISSLISEQLGINS